MPRGGERRQLRPGQDRELEHASLLLAAMFRDDSQRGRQFQQAERALFQSWQRLIEALARHASSSGLSGPFNIPAAARYLELVRFGRHVPYPRPPEISDLDLREVVARTRLRHGNASRDRGAAADVRIVDVIDALCELIEHPTHQPAKLRSSRRLAVRRYIAELETFCAAWRLRAWWAVPAIFSSQLRRVDPDALPAAADTFDLLIGEAGTVPSFPIVVRLPGRDEPEYRADRVLADAVVQEELDLGPGTSLTVRRRPSRAEMAAMERGADAACVTVDWDGRPTYASRFGPGGDLDIVAYIVDECAARLGRPLTFRETAHVRRQAVPQIEQARAALREAGYHVDSGAPVNHHARWLARRLLDPACGWERLAIMEELAGGPSPHRGTIRNACLRFAARAGLPSPESVLTSRRSLALQPRLSNCALGWVHGRHLAPHRPGRDRPERPPQDGEALVAGRPTG